METEQVIVGLRRVRPLALEVYLRGNATVIGSWQQAAKARDASKYYAAFAKFLYPACAQFLGNGGLEGDFSKFVSVNLFTKGLDAVLKRAIAKLRIDGPHPDEFLFLDTHESSPGLPRDGKAVSILGWVEKVQTMYKRLFGERYMTREETNRNQHLYLDPRRGVPRSNARSGFAQLARKRKAQSADLATLPASSRRRECVLGEAPSAAEKEQL